MKHSESIKEIAAALSVAQGKVKGAVKDSQNPFFKSSYADLGSVMDAIRDAFSEQGLSYIQPLCSEGEKYFIETAIMHKSGEWLTSDRIEVIIKDKTNPQAFGSSVTYFRRYSLCSMVGIAQVDDDGNAAARVDTVKVPVTNPRQMQDANFQKPPPAQGVTKRPMNHAHGAKNE
jgi:hypothetical protein